MNEAENYIMIIRTHFHIFQLLATISFVFSFQLSHHHRHTPFKSNSFHNLISTPTFSSSSPCKITSTPPPKTTTSTQLKGKLWDKLQIEPDPMDEPSLWYVLNCICTQEQELLAQVKHVTVDMDESIFKKAVVPLHRALRSHGKTKKVVEMKVRYPGYVFCKMRLCAETYEALQVLPLCRSWMAGTVNHVSANSYRKLPPVPIALSDEEVVKFKGLEEETMQIYEKYGEDYTGKGDDGDDLVSQYEGYNPDDMVKILTGNFQGEDGIVKRLKDGEIMVRLYTYGQVLDQWFKPDQIRTMTDLEAMKGLTGPTSPISQDDFNESVGIKKKKRSTFDGEDRRGGRDGGSLRSNLMNSVGGSGAGGGGGGRRNTRFDRMSRGERGTKDAFGRDSQEQKDEEENWRRFREEQRAKSQQKRGDSWGMKERSSMSGQGDQATSDLYGSSNSEYKSGRKQRKDRNNRKDQYDSVASALEGGDDWNLFTDDAATSDSGNSQEDDFFSNLMSELSNSLDEDDSDASNSKGGGKGQQGNGKPQSNSAEDDFFTSLMTELSDTSSGPSRNQNGSNNDEYFSSLEADLNESLGSIGGNMNDQTATNNSEDDFFASLESELGDLLSSDDDEASSSPKMKETTTANASPQTDDDFFSSLESDLDSELSASTTSGGNSDDDFFANLEGDLNEELSSSTTSTSKEESKSVDHAPTTKTASSSGDLSKLTVPILKGMLKEKGLKVSGKKSELIERLQQH